MGAKRSACWCILLSLALVLAGCESPPRENAAAAATRAAAKATEAAAEATKAAAAQSHVQATKGAPAATPGAARSTAVPTPARKATAPPMPAPKTCAQESPPFWHWQAGQLTINAFFFVTPRLGLAVGEPNAVLRTEDGGSTWTLWPLDCPQALNSVYFTDAKTGWIAGDDGTILHTADGGLSWQAQRSGTAENLHVIKFLDHQTGWAGGDRCNLLRTTDGGATWLPGATGAQFTIVDLSFVDAREGYVAGHTEVVGNVLHTTDGGATWQPTSYWGSVPEAIFADGLTTWIAGGWVGGTLWRGIGHDSLTAVVQETHPGACSGTGYHFRTIYFSDAQHGWAAGDCGLALATQDGGTSWQPMGVDDRANWSMLRFASKNEAVLAGYDWQGGIRVAHSSDGGKTWSPASASRSSTERLIVASLDVVDPWFGWALVRPRPLDSTFLLLTNDGGQAWAQREVLGGAGSQVQFVDRLRGWIVGSAGLVARSDDGGQTWQIQSLPFSRNVQALSFVDREHGWVLTGDLFMAGTCEECEDEQKCLALFRTSSGGDTWEGPICIQLPGVPARSALVATEIALQLVDENRGWLVAAKGTIMKTSDGGSTWQPQASGTAVDLRDVHFLDAQTGWVTGKDGVLLATTDGGASWKQQRLGTKDLLAVHFVDKQTGWVTAKGPSGFQTTDGGRTWTSVDLPDWTELPSLDAIDGSHVWVGTSLGIRAYAPVCLP